MRDAGAQSLETRKRISLSRDTNAEKGSRIMKIRSASQQTVVQSTTSERSFATSLFLLAILWTTIFVVPLAWAQGDPPPPARFADDRILVKPNPNADLTALHTSLGTTVLRSFPAIGNLEVVQLPSNESVTNMLVQFKQSGLVQYAEPDWIVRAINGNPPNETHYVNGDLWGLHNIDQLGPCNWQVPQIGPVAGDDIHAQDGWGLQTSAANIIVAVIDTGVRYDHEDLGVNMWVNPVDGGHGLNTVNNGHATNDPWDDYGHGTHVAGIIGAAGNNGIGVVGVCWQVQIMACKFLTSNGTGLVSDAITCIDYASTKGAKIINASWGDYVQGVASLDNGILDLGISNFRSLYDAVDRARQARIIFVAACGNDGANNDNTTTRLFPASFTVDNVDSSTGQTLPALDNIIAVAATDSGDRLAAFPGSQSSNYGATTVYLGAPGVNIYSCWNGSTNDYQCDWGTSMAAPYVAGACALVSAHYPNDSYQQIIQRVLTAVDPVPSLAGKTKTGGRLELYWAPLPNRTRTS